MATKMSDSFNAPIITADRLTELMSTQNIIILDTREQKEFNVSHIKNAIYVGYDNFDIDTVLKKIKKGSVVIAYCSVGYRSGDIAERLKKQGVDVYNLYGGIFNWINTGKNLYSNSNDATDEIHGYDRDWSKWLTTGKVSY
jgi:rhodanese-related sulfurtransferase